MDEHPYASSRTPTVLGRDDAVVEQRRKPPLYARPQPPLRRRPPDDLERPCWVGLESGVGTLPTKEGKPAKSQLGRR